MITEKIYINGIGVPFELVTCGECKWWDSESSECDRIHPLIPFRELDFCSYGEIEEE